MISGIFGLLIFILDIYAILQVLGSSATPLKKALWVMAIFFLPVLGLLVWYVAGPKKTQPIAL